MKRAIWSILLIAGLLLVLGTAGASDRDAISDRQVSVYLTCGAVAVGMSLFGLYLENERESKRLH